MMTLAQFCEERGQSLAATVDLMRVLQDEQTFEMARHNALLNRRGASELECKPIVDQGDELGRVKWHMSGKAFFHLMQQKNFGYDGLMSKEGDRDIVKGFPQFRVRTVSGKVVGVGFGPGKRTTVKRYETN
jgi:hypothetical protein